MESIAVVPCSGGFANYTSMEYDLFDCYIKNAPISTGVKHYFIRRLFSYSPTV